MPVCRIAVRLERIREAVADIETFVAGLTFEGYLQDRLVRRAVKRSIEIISEASRHVPKSLKQRYASVPWSSIAGTGNIVRHEYEVVDDHEIWRVAKDHIRPLKTAVDATLAEIGADESE